MALLNCESFEALSSSTAALKYATFTGTIVTTQPSGRGHTNAARFVSSQTMVYTIATPVNSVIIGFAMAWDAATPTAFLRFTSELGTIQCSLVMGAEGRLFFVRGSTLTSGNLITAMKQVSYNIGWIFVEVKVLISDTVGTLEVRANGEVLYSNTGLDTRSDTGSSLIGSITFVGPTSPTTILWLSDWYLATVTGNTPTDFLGDITIESKLPNANGTVNDFTPSAGSNYQNVDDAAPDSDTTTNTASSAGNQDLYNFTNLTNSGINAIYAVQHNFTVKKNLGANRTIKDLVRSGGSTYEGQGDTASVSPSNSYVVYSSRYITDPFTGVAWTEAGVNNAEFGIKINS